MLLSRIFLLLFLTAFTATAADTDLLVQHKDSLNKLARQMQRGENDSARQVAANIFDNILEKILSDSSSFSASFDSIKNISAKSSSDNKVRLYTWQYPSYEGDHYYYFGYLQYKKKNKIILTRLQDSSYVLQKPSSKKLKPENWYGCIYYSIIDAKRNGKTYYSLLGWRATNKTQTQKVMDALTLEPAPAFGLPVFKKNNIFSNRVIFEYNSQATMTLRYEADRKLIVLDHLSAGNKQYSEGSPVGPDGTYDAYKLDKKGFWYLIEDVDVDAGFVPKKQPVKVYKDEELPRK